MTSLEFAGTATLALMIALVGCRGDDEPATGSPSDGASASAPTAAVSDASATTSTTSATADACGDGCTEHEICVDDPGTCACTPGFALCGRACVDLRVDARHCGRCDAACSGPCAGGLCGATVPAPPSPPPQRVSDDRPASSCQELNEGKPERSINHAPGGVEYHLAYQHSGPSPRGYFNGASPAPGRPWDAVSKQLPVDADASALIRMSTVEGDPWTATHGGSGLEYATLLGTTAPNVSCVGVAATDAASLAAGVWTHPFACAHPPVNYESDWRVDGPVIVADLGDDALYTAYTALDFGAQRTRFRVQRYAPCEGVPRPDASAGCPLQWDRFVVKSHTLNEHPNLVVNPCTHHALALYRETTQGELDAIRLAALDTRGDALFNVVLDEVAWGVNSDCGGDACEEDLEICKCGGTDPASCAGADAPTPTCMDLAARVHGVAVYRPEDDACRLYLAYDYFTPDGLARVRARVYELDGDAPALLQTIESSPEGSGANDFSGTVLSDYFSARAGVFFYRQPAHDGCDTRYVGLVTGDGETFSEVQVSASSFPSLWFPRTRGLGHYVAGPRFSEPGVLFPTWSQPVATSADCVSCQGQQYSLAILGRRVFVDAP